MVFKSMVHTVLLGRHEPYDKLKSTRKIAGKISEHYTDIKVGPDLFAWINVVSYSSLGQSLAINCNIVSKIGSHIHSGNKTWRFVASKN